MTPAASRSPNCSKRDVFGVKRLDLLHEYLRRRRRALGTDEVLTVHDNLTLRRLMQDLPDDSPFYRLYRHFMWKVLAPTVGQPLSYSSHPKMRVHLPDTPSVSSFHSDVPVTKRIDQVNLWMPFTDVDDAATLWLESFYGRGDYAPVPVARGSTHLRRRLSQPRVGTQPHADHQGQPGHALLPQGRHDAGRGR